MMLMMMSAAASRRRREREEEEERQKEEKRQKRLQEIEKEGRDAFFAGLKEDVCPYIGTADYINWISGFNQAAIDFDNNKKTFAEWLLNPKDRLK